MQCPQFQFTATDIYKTGTELPPTSKAFMFNICKYFHHIFEKMCKKQYFLVAVSLSSNVLIVNL